jgi:hypothetical protein
MEQAMGFTDRNRGRSINNWNLTKYSLLSAAGGMVASPTQTQAGATPITTMYASFGTVASAGNAARLLPAKAGLQITVFNETATSMNVFPAGAAQGGAAGGDTIKPTPGAANSALAVVTGTPTIFTCLVDGVWWTK